MMKRLHIVVGGVVQGVCFRYYAQQRAEQLGVAGWVRNLPDGRVEAVIEGEDGAVGAMAEWFRHGPPGALVDEFHSDERKYRGEFSDFKVAGYYR